MPKYAALLRGISPTDPRMHNQKLRSVFESLGFTNVKSVISSGNIIFESPRTDVRAMEAQAEKTFRKQLGFTSMTIICTVPQLRRLVQADPFKGMQHGQKTYLTVTFLKREPRPALTFPYQPVGKPYTIVAKHGRALCSVMDMMSSKTPDLMVWLERQFGKDITTRTWLTVLRILKNMD